MPPSLPAFSQLFRYGDFTARGIAGGLAGENVDAALAVWAASPKRAAAMEVNLMMTTLCVGQVTRNLRYVAN